MSTRITSELFAIPHDGQVILYAPHRHLAMLVNPALVEVLRAPDPRTAAAGSEPARKVLDFLEAAGIVNGPPEVEPSTVRDTDWRPTTVTLFPTSDCNLRCTYCYASAGERKRTMSWEVARAALDFVNQNALTKGGEKVTLNFHGGGEPTYAWDIFTRATTYERSFAEEHGLQLDVQSATNGVLSPKQVDWIASNLTSVGVSLDGPPEFHDAQRPTVSGQGSFAIVARTLERFDQLGFPYGLRMTFTRESVGLMLETVDFVTTHFRPRHVRLEPLFECGRAETEGLVPPDPREFMHGFLDAKKLAKQRGVPVSYSGARVDALTDRFCGAAAIAFNVTSEGFLSSCVEVTSPTDAEADVFFYGQYDQRTRRFVLWPDRIDRLRTFTTSNMPHCGDCFIRWHCAGDCPARVIRTYGELGTMGSPRCEVNQELSKHQLIELFGLGDNGAPGATGETRGHEAACETR